MVQISQRNSLRDPIKRFHAFHTHCAQAIDKIKGNIEIFCDLKIRSTRMEPFLEEITFVADSGDVRDDWIMVLKNVLNRLWQPYFEALFM